MKPQPLPVLAHVACGLAVMLLLPDASSASQLAYEGFDYPAGSGNLTGQAGGAGWGGAWQTITSGSADMIAGNLAATGNAPVGFDSNSIGNSCNLPNNRRVGRLLDTTAGGTFESRGYRDANGRIGADGKTIYISFLQQPNGATSYYEFEFHRDDLGDGGRIGGIGNDQGTATGVFLRAPNTTHTAVGTGNAAVNFYVVRIDFKAGNDDVYVYQNPGSATEPGVPTLTKLGAADMSFNGISFGAFNNARTVSHDEVRMGESWADVVCGTTRPPPIRIMPLGDSITYGASIAGGYRNKLYQLLSAAGYTVDFVGNQSDNPAATLPDSDHEGHSGWIISQLDQNIPTWFGTIADPDVILVHIGTNDFGVNADPANAINRLDALITKMATLRPYAHIIVTNLMERSEPYNTSIQAQFNPYVQARVNAQAALGRRVTFLDMRSAVPLAEMPDQLHPGQAGYDHMADAWFPAIQAVIGTTGDSSPPGLSKASGAADLTHVAITFSKPVADSAAVVGNFSLSGGLTISAASLDATKRIVTLTTSVQTRAATYTATVNGVVDRTAGALPLPANSTVDFMGALQRGYLNNVPESAGYTLAYSLDLPNAANYSAGPVPYSVDNHNGIGPFSRIAYYVELQSASGDLKYVWASVNAFTTDASKIAVPNLASGATFQQGVTGMTVISNVSGLNTGSGLTGNLEFWPGNYEVPNGAGVAGASGSVYDFGDTFTAGGYGCMQLHNTGAGQTVFAFNNWGGNQNPGNLDIGIGNNPSAGITGLDWTFANNAGGYAVKTLQVLVQTTGDSSPPTLTSAAATFGRTQIVVRFSEPLAGASVKPENFTLSDGVVVLGATLAANQRDVCLLTTPQPSAASLTLAAGNIRDSSPSANLIAPGSSIAVNAPALPPEIVTNVGAAASDYQLVASINLPVHGNFNSSNAAYTLDDRAATGAFSRVAYYLELQKPNQAAQYVWASMDAFTASRAKLAFPTFASGAFFQQNVTNLSVVSNVSGVVNGTTATGGNIEMWPNSYLEANALGIANASASIFDTGDTRTPTTSAGYGCFQVHNHAAGQTVFALNNYGVDGYLLDAGIGNNPAPTVGATDWTFSNNSAAYSRRILHVLVLPGSALPAGVAANVPNAAGYQLVYSLNIPASGTASSIVYGVNNSADITPFTRIGYYLELQTGAATPQYIWTSMDAFTTNAARIGVPTAASGGFFQQNVTNLDVLSNVAGIVNGTTSTGGNIEFWPGGYNQTNGINIPNASASTFDFGDGGASAVSGYGSMQVHNHDAGAKQTLFAFNRFDTTGSVFDLGIGNDPAPVTGGVDWTFAQNANTYSNRTLHVFVLLGNPDATGPVIAGAKGSITLNRLVVAFNETVSDSSALASNFSIPGLTVTGAVLLGGQKEIALTTSAQTAGTVYTVNVTGVRDRSSAGNAILAGASTTFTAYTPSAVFANIPELSGYKLAYKVALPATSPLWNLNTIPYSVDESRYGEQTFDRVAYLMELDSNYACASFDRHTNQIAKVGIPTFAVAPGAFQQNVSNLTVVSNVAGVVNGSTATGGNIEFWGGDYVVANGLGVPGASASTFDFGDTMTAGGHGCFQIHNHDAGALQTVMAFNNWGSNTGTTAVGIGNRPTSQPDWTFADNGASYTTRNLYVFVRPGGTPIGTAPVLLTQPLSRVVNPGANTGFTITASGTGPFTYQWRRNGSNISGATNPWLDIPSVSMADLGSYDVVVTGPTTLSTTSLQGVLSLTPPFDLWVNGYPSITGSNKLPAADPDGDGFSNLLEYAFGTDPSVTGGGLITYANGVVSAHGQPTTGITSNPEGVDYRAVFGRRKDYLTAGLTYTVQFSAGLNVWVNSTDTPTVVASDAAIDAVSVPYPLFIPTANGVEKPTFFRVGVSSN